MNTVKHWMQGPIAWMASNPVAANILMLAIFIGGLFAVTEVKKEVFPYFDLAQITVSITVDGATPEEMERSVAFAIEEAVESLDGVDETSAMIGSGYATITIQAVEDMDGNILLQDVKSAVDRITTFPKDADKPIISLRSTRFQVLTLVLTGDAGLDTLRYWADIIREDLVQDSSIAQVSLEGVRDHEILVEIPQDTLRRYKLTISDVSTAISQSAIEQGGGTVNASSGDILMRLNERRNYANEFANIPVRSNADGSRLVLEDIASISDTFDDSTNWSEFNNQEAIPIYVYSFGKVSPEDVSKATMLRVERFNAIMPQGLTLHVRDNQATSYIDRRNLLLDNAFVGMALVFICLALFLRPSLALWVSLGIPISIWGSFWLFGPLGISLNMISLFAFLITLGIVVDDAIVVGENVNAWQERGASPLKAAVCGTREVAVPVVFSVLTNILAFLPILYIPGSFGMTWRVIPLIVVAVFTMSLIESLFILPAHLAHTRKLQAEAAQTKKSLLGRLGGRQQAFNRAFLRFVDTRFTPFLEIALHWRYLTISIAIAILCITMAYVKSGRMGFDLMPRIEGDVAFVSVSLPEGTPTEEMLIIKEHVVQSAQQVIDKNGGKELSRGISVFVRGESFSANVYLTSPDVRPIGTTEFTEQWRDAVGAVAGVESIFFRSDNGGPGSGDSLTVRLSHHSTASLDDAAEELGRMLAKYPGVGDVSTGTTKTVRQFDVKLTPFAERLGLSAQDVSSQMRYAFEGSLALRQQRDTSEVTVRVRLPEEERDKEATFEDLIIYTPDGQELLLRDVIEVEDTRAEAMIRHTNGRRTTTVSANISPASQTGNMMQVLRQEIMPELQANFAGLTWEFGGRQQDMQRSTDTMYYGFILSLLGVYALLAIPFKSYTKPFIIMLAIPFGIVGAVIGHIIMDYSLSVVSLFGIVALSGVVVNDSLVLIDFAERRRRKGENAHDCIVQAAAQRFRPIFLTTVTTFAGLAPLIFETSRQAQFLIPMAISLAFGILFATVICLLLVPPFYMVVDDIENWWKKKMKDNLGV